MAHRTQEELRHELDAAREVVEVGGTYVHFKNPDREYVVRGLAILEATEEVAVLYEAQYGEKIAFIRPLLNFIAPVEHEGQSVLRFQKVVR
ncbi:MAG TPA: DUF1653 domain-containing protein [Candidatus Paceibacterota bacterium]|nr:DUF1653 domain-containing protein [Candidatus Paceibacterota bacterium]